MPVLLSNPGELSTHVQQTTWFDQIARISQRTLRDTNSSLRTTFDFSERKQANSGENSMRNQCYFQALANFPHMLNNQNGLTTRKYTSQRTFRDIISSRTNKCCRFPTQTSKFKGKCILYLLI